MKESAVERTIVNVLLPRLLASFEILPVRRLRAPFSFFPKYFVGMRNIFLKFFCSSECDASYYGALISLLHSLCCANDRRILLTSGGVRRE